MSVVVVAAGSVESVASGLDTEGGVVVESLADESFDSVCVFVSVLVSVPAVVAGVTESECFS